MLDSSSTRESSKPSVLVSFIICTRDNAASLGRTLAVFADIAIPQEWRAELIVVDNGSTDTTAELVRLTSLPNMETKYVYEPKRGLSNARNAGLANARGEFVLFTDDDALPSADWAKYSISAMLQEGCDAVAGKFTVAEDLIRGWMKPQHLALMGDSTSSAELGYGVQLIGGNMGFRRSVLSRVNGFDPELGAGALGYAEETLFGRQLCQAGMSIQYVPSASVIHNFDPSRLRRVHWLSLAEKQGRTDAYLCHHWEHTTVKFARIKCLYYLTKLRLRRLLQGSPSLQEEGCSLWEISYVRQVEYYRQLSIESKRQRNYTMRGLNKLHA